MLGILILNYKSYQDTFLCVDSVRENIGETEYRIYIVENGSPNESYDMLYGKYKDDSDITLIKSEVNGGFSAGNNIGFKRAVKDGCDAVLCTNSDVIFKPSSIQIMYKRLFEDEKCGVVGPKVYRLDGSVQNANKGLLDCKTFVLRIKGLNLFDFKGLERKYSYLDYDYKEPLYPAGMVSGCCFMIKSNVIDEIGYLDENVFLYYEENILGAKLTKAGYYVVLDPSAEIVHCEGKSTSGSSAFVRYHKFYSGLYFLWNYNAEKSRKKRFANFVIKSIFFIRGIFNKEYRKYYKLLKKNLKQINLKAKSF